MLVSLRGTLTLRLHIGLCKLQSLGRCTDLTLGKVSYLFISYNNVISWLLIAWQCNPWIDRAKQTKYSSNSVHVQASVYEMKTSRHWAIFGHSSSLYWLCPLWLAYAFDNWLRWCSSSRKVSHEWLATLWEYNRTNNRNNAPPSLNFSRLFPLPRVGRPRPTRGKGKRRLKFRLNAPLATKH